jgi:hypothetical protein
MSTATTGTIMIDIIGVAVIAVVIPMESLLAA